MSSDEAPDTAAGEMADAEWDDWRDDDAADGDDEPAHSLFGSVILPCAAAALDHDAKQHDFDLRKFRLERRLDEYGVIRCINYIRSEVAAGRDPRQYLSAGGGGGGGGAPWAGDQYLQPVLPDDALLMHDFDEDDGAAAQPMDACSNLTAFDELSYLRAQNEALRTALKSASILEDVREDSDAERDPAPAADGGPGAAATPPSDPAGQAMDGLSGRRGRKVSFSSALAVETGRVDDSYFASYSYFDIHREMLADKARTEAYRDMLEQNPSLLRGATVLDVGCGTGILSLFAARAGASTVIGVDGSARIADFAQQIASRNGLLAEEGGPVHIVAGKVEELAELPAGARGSAVTQVDAIVSEWMGYALLFESMLDSVLVARDWFLRPGGAMLPDVAVLHVAGGGPKAGGLSFWADVYGFDMTPVAEAMQEAALHDAVVAPVDEKHLVTQPQRLHHLDLATMSAADADFTAPFRLQPLAGQETKPAECCSLVLWFDVEFSSRVCREHPVTLSTAPHAPQTHWTQTILSFRKPITLGGEGAAAIQGRISLARADRHRALDISAEYWPVQADGSAGEATALMYNMKVS